MKQLLQIVTVIAIGMLSIQAHAQGLTQITMNQDSMGSRPINFVAIGNTMYFTANDGIHGQELWKTDGTAAGTVMVKDIFPGPNSSQPFNLINFRDTLYFGASDPVNGQELWKTDGTTAGTVLVKDINPGVYAGYTTDRTMMPVVVNNNLYFAGQNGTNGVELWKTDGTAAGTVMVKDINTGSADAMPSNLTKLNNSVVFTVTINYNSQLWISDGTSTGTRALTSSSGSFFPFGAFTTANNKVFMFAINYTTSGAFGGLWATDGTSITLTKSYVDNVELTNTIFNTIGNTVFFQGAGSNLYNDLELWKSDGTVAGTVLVKDIYPGPGSSLATIGTSAVVGSTLYFTANDSTNGKELWKTDGTTAGTVLVKNIYPGTASSFATSLCNMNGVLYFSADDGVNGMELWKSDGTAAGTVMVANINRGAYGSFPTGITALNNNILFSATDGVNGMELWKSDGTTSGTTLLNDIRTMANETAAPDLTSFYAIPGNNGLYFTGYDERYGNELYFTNGTVAGTSLVKDLCPGNASSLASQFTTLNNSTFFAASDDYYDIQLWKTDGTAAGTSMIRLPQGYVVPSINTLTTANGALYFVGYDPTAADGSLAGVFTSDGTSAGTHLIHHGYSNQNDIRYFAGGVNGNVVFQTQDSLYKTDGTLTGTAAIMQIQAPEAPYLATLQPVVINNTLYFSASNGINGFELWKTNGTTAGTILVKDINAGSASSSPANFTNVNGVLVFTATDATGVELWRSDGTTAGTTLLKGNGCNPVNLAMGPGNMLYFEAADPGHGSAVGLWKTDGTVAGTVLVTDIYPGYTSINPAALVRAGNYLFFYATDANDPVDYNLYRTDGTAAGTIKIASFPGNYYPQPLYVSGNYLYTATMYQPQQPYDPITYWGGPTTYTYIPSFLNYYTLWSYNFTQSLPVQLLNFNARANGNNVDCNWQTSHEINTDHYTVERSTDGSHFTAIGSVNAKGDASSSQSYTYTDYNAKQLQYTTLYYRLQSVDKDGSYSYSSVASVTFTESNTFSLFPNPASSKVTIRGNNLTSVQVIDNTGKTVMSQQVNGINSLTLDIAHLSKGLYFVQMKDSKGNMQTEKLVVE